MSNLINLNQVEVFLNGESLGVYTREGYKELTLQMSTGDFHVHTTKPAYAEPEVVIDKYIVVDWINNPVSEPVLGTFSDVVDHMFAIIPNPDDSEDAYDDYHVVSYRVHKQTRIA